jgi:hypothetical protein
MQTCSVPVTAKRGQILRQTLRLAQQDRGGVAVGIGLGCICGSNFKTQGSQWESGDVF